MKSETAVDLDQNRWSAWTGITGRFDRNTQREGKPDGFHYLQHRTVDGRHGFILDVLVTSAAMTDAQVYP
ncbi:MAG: hypothetical protein CWE10_14750, partial [Symbiobacterium thermophilum]|nr:hypothetical protein [Symbiobacterium thermophilum]